CSTTTTAGWPPSLPDLPLSGDSHLINLTIPRRPGQGARRRLPTGRRPVPVPGWRTVCIGPRGPVPKVGRAGSVGNGGGHVADRWYFARDGQQSGPFLAAKLQELAAGGQLMSQDGSFIQEGAMPNVPTGQPCRQHLWERCLEFHGGIECVVRF